MIIINGHPKSGTNALLKAVSLLGQTGIHMHREFGNPLPPGTTKHILVIRNLKNVVISRLRQWDRPITPENFKRLAQSDVLPRLANFAGWMTAQNLHIVKYEDLIASDIAIRGIAEYLEVPFVDSAFTNLPGETVTWKEPPHSDYTKIWNADLDAFWIRKHGSMLDKVFGYAS